MNQHRFKSFALRTIFCDLVGIHYPTEIVRLIMWLYYKSFRIKLSCDFDSNWVLIDSEIYVWDNNGASIEQNFGFPIKKISHGSCHTVLLDSDYCVWTYGSNQLGQLGLGDRINRTEPTKLNLSDVRSVGCIRNRSMALTGSGKIYLWGKDEIVGSDSIMVPTVFDVAADPIVKVGLGGYHTVVLNESSKLYSWGFNDYGQLGQAIIENRYETQPKILQLVPKSIRKISCGISHTLVLATDNKVYAWGFNGSGQLGLGHMHTMGTPTEIPNLSSVCKIKCGLHYSVALTTDSEVYVWGSNINGQLGLIRSTYYVKKPTKLNFLFPVIKIACGNLWSTFLTSDLTMHRFGYGGMMKKIDI